MEFDNKYWDNIIDIVDETFDTAIKGIKEVTDNALQEMRKKMKKDEKTIPPSNRGRTSS